MKKIAVLMLLLLFAGCSAAKIEPIQNSQGVVDMTNNPVLNIAHRGARSIAPENTLLAARKGLEIGADWWELDVAMTKDNQMVIIHDPSLERTSNAKSVFAERKSWNVGDFSLQELHRLDFGSWYLSSDPFGEIKKGSVSVEDQKEFVGVVIPTLREALEFTRDNQWKVNVEIKDHKGKPADATIVESVVNLIAELGMQQSVIISSFNHDYIVRVKKADASIRTAALTNSPEIDPLAKVNYLGADAFNPSYKYIEADQVAKLRAAGKDVYVWTVNDEATMRKLIAMGVSGIITDYPQLLKQVIASYSK